MVIYIDKSIGRTQSLTGPEEILYQNLAHAYSRGKCYLCGDLTSIDWLKHSLTGRDSAAYAHVLGNNYQTRSIIEIVERAIVLTVSDQPDIPNFLEGKAQVLKISDAVTCAFDTNCALVCENKDDCEFYELLAQRYFHTHKVKGLQLSLDITPGGGSTLGETFETCVNTKRIPSLCIVDSDWKYDSSTTYPDKPRYGSTANKAKEKFSNLNSKYGSALCELYCLPVHEVENLIPLGVLSCICQQVPDMKKGVSYLQKLQKASYERAILFYDFKNGGDRIKEKIANGESAPAKAYWSPIWQAIDDDSMPAICKNILSKALSTFQSPPPNPCYIDSVSVDSYLSALWENLGRKIFSWGCSVMEKRA